MDLSDKLKNLLENFLQTLDNHKVEFLMLVEWQSITMGIRAAGMTSNLWYNPTQTNFERILKALEANQQDITELKNLVSTR